MKLTFSIEGNGDEISHSLYQLCLLFNPEREMSEAEIEATNCIRRTGQFGENADFFKFLKQRSAERKEAELKFMFG